MVRYYFSCVILKSDGSIVSVDMSFDSLDIATLVYNQFKDNLMEENYGLILSPDKNDIYKNNFSYLEYDKKLKPATGNYVITIYRKDRIVCKLEMPNSQTYFSLFAILRSYGLKYFIKKERHVK